MNSTFHGLETAKRALFAQQNGLYTTGNNIANANTLGYTRQRVNFAATEGWPPASMNRSQFAGQLGTGVSAESIHRVREFYLDVQYRAENAKVGYYASNASAMAKLEDILNETGKDPVGLARVLNDFRDSWQELSTNPENDGVREVVIQRGHAVADTFQHLYNTIQFYRQDLGKQVDGDVDKINSLLRGIDDLNRQIAQMEPHGYLPNNLYDERDRLVDELSGYMAIEVEKIPSESNGNAKAIAEGIYVIRVNGIEIVNKDRYLELQVDRQDGYVANVSFGGVPVEFEDLPLGKMKSLIENYGYDDGKGTYPELLAKLDSLADEFAANVNGAHAKGFKKDGQQGGNLFIEGAGAAGIKMLDQIEPDDLAPSLTIDGSGDGKNARNVAESIQGVMSEYERMIGRIGVEAQFANQQRKSAATLKTAVEENRLSVGTVSLDEEMMDMIKFQHAYNAAARTITVIDEMLDKIVNGMGVGGR